MGIVTVVLCYTCALLCCLTSCISSTTCQIKLDRSVYAFPSNILSDLTRSESNYGFSFKIDVRRNAQTKSCSQINWSAKSLTFSTHGMTRNANLSGRLQNLEETGILFPQVHQLKFTISAITVFRHFGSPTFGTLLDDMPRMLANSAHPKRPVKLDMEYDMTKHSSSKMMVDINVLDSDDFVTNPDRFEYCVVGVPNITLSAVLLSGTRHSGITSETYHIPLATDVDVSQSDNAWWESNSTRVNETLVNVRFAFAVSALWSATKAVLSQQNKTSKLSHSANSDVIVNITLQVTATSGRTNPQRRNATFILVLYCKQAILAASTQVTTADELSSAAESTPVPTEDKLSSAAATTPVTTEDKLSIASASTPVPTEVKLSSHAASTPVPTKDKRFFTSASFSQPISHKVTTALDEKSVTTFVVAVLLVGFTLCGIVLFIVLLELYNVICDKPLLLLRL